MLSRRLNFPLSQPELQTVNCEWSVCVCVHVIRPPSPVRQPPTAPQRSGSLLLLHVVPFLCRHWEGLLHPLHDSLQPGIKYK